MIFHQNLHQEFRFSTILKIFNSTIEYFNNTIERSSIDLNIKLRLWFFFL